MATPYSRVAPRPASTAEAPAPPRKSAAFNPAAHGLRGIASLMVFVAHMLSGTAEHIYPHNAAYVAATRAPWYFGTYGVELFFVISGFVILPSVRRYTVKEFALRRFLRLYPLFFVLSVLFVALNAVTNEYPRLNNLPAVASGFLFLNLFNGTEQLTPNAWSLTYEVFFYVMLCLGYQFVVRRFRPLAGGVVVAAFLVFWYLCPIVTYFVFGLLIRTVHDRGLRVPREWAWPVEVLAAICCIWFASRGWFAYSRADLANPVAIAIMVSTGIFFLVASQPGSLTAKLFSGRWIVWLGTVSYSLYLVHPYTYFACRNLFKQLGLFGDNVPLSILAFFLVTTPITLILTQAVHVMLEVGPYQWYFRQQIYRTGTRPEPAVTS